jgi:hypothetical protein
MSDGAREFLEKFPGDLAETKQAVPDTIKGFGTLFPTRL